MSDGRRSQWIAFDSMFFGGSTYDDIMERFGPAGVVVWVAYLCACKRNLVPGQITVIGEADTLAQLGLVGLELVDQDGVRWDLDTYWTRLGQLKNVSRRRRGRASDILCTRWEAWQDNGNRQRRAESKRRSRPENSGTLDGRYGDDTDPETDRDRDIETDKDNDAAETTPSLALVPVETALVTVGDFPAFWSAYPRKVDKKKAERAYERALKAADHDVIVDGLARWLPHFAAKDPDFTPHPTTWLNGERWNDSPPTRSTSQVLPKGAESVMAWSAKEGT